jgi:DNA-binding transcriptional LysR family regulator
MDRLDSRALRYFIAVAEELHFGRAAERLGIAQPPLSRAIRQLESRLGVPLFQRTSRAVRLTGAGQVLLGEGRHALAALDAAARRAQRAGQPRPALAVALKADNDGGLLPAILAAYRREQAAIPAEGCSAAGVSKQACCETGVLTSPWCTSHTTIAALTAKGC